jgi:hypothetical protein
MSIALIISAFVSQATLQKSDMPPISSTLQNDRASAEACSLPTGVRMEFDMNNLPSEIKDDLMKWMPNIDKGFHDFDKPSSRTHAETLQRRFVLAVKGKHLSWRVVYQRGGDINFRVIEYYIHNVSLGATGPYVISPHSVLQGPLCPLLSASFSGVRSVSPPNAF